MREDSAGRGGVGNWYGLRAGFVRGDLDGFFALFIDNLLQLMLIAVLCPLVCGFPQELVIGRILPGAAISILFGNVFYAWQARRLMRQTGRTDVTALPYGINTPSLFAYIFLVMGPVYQETRDPTLAWQVGLFACLLSGVMETAGAFVGDWLRRYTRAGRAADGAGRRGDYVYCRGFYLPDFCQPAHCGRAADAAADDLRRPLPAARRFARRAGGRADGCGSCLGAARPGDAGL